MWFIGSKITSPILTTILEIIFQQTFFKYIFLNSILCKLYKLYYHPLPVNAIYII